MCVRDYVPFFIIFYNIRDNECVRWSDSDVLVKIVLCHTHGAILIYCTFAYKKKRLFCRRKIIWYILYTGLQGKKSSNSVDVKCLNARLHFSKKNTQIK